MTDVLYHPLIDRDTAGLDKSPLFCSPDREKVAGTAALYLEELVPKRYRLIAREEHTTRQASAYRIHCPHLRGGDASDLPALKQASPVSMSARSASEG